MCYALFFLTFFLTFQPKIEKNHLPLQIIFFAVFFFLLCCSIIIWFHFLLHREKISHLVRFVFVFCLLIWRNFSCKYHNSRIAFYGLPFIKLTYEQWTQRLFCLSSPSRIIPVSPSAFCLNHSFELCLIFWCGFPSTFLIFKISFVCMWNGKHIPFFIEQRSLAKISQHFSCVFYFLTKKHFIFRTNIIQFLILFNSCLQFIIRECINICDISLTWFFLVYVFSASVQNASSLSKLCYIFFYVMPFFTISHFVFWLLPLFVSIFFLCRVWYCF